MEAHNALAPRAADPYEGLKESIYLGDLQPGQHLVEVSLAQTFNVSRTPIREALSRLEHDGLLVRTRMGLGESFDFFDLGRRWIVKSFAALTTPRMHEVWRRKA